MKRKLLILYILITILANLADVSLAEGNATVTYADAQGNLHTQTGVTMVTSGTVTWQNGWYAVSGDVTIARRVQIQGTVNLILCDGASLTARKGINLPGGKN